MIITIDGPAGAGKSTAAALLAERLGFRILNTGSLYRMVTLAAIERSVAPDDPEELASLLSELDLALDGTRAFLSGSDVTARIREPDVARSIGRFADLLEVRRLVTARSRQIAREGRFVTDGRDQGTEVFPDAAVKFFLTADPRVRAERRAAELIDAGKTVDVDQIEQAIRRRDIEDRSRPVGALKRADDAIDVDTTRLTIEQVAERLESLARPRLAR